MLTSFHINGHSITPPQTQKLEQFHLGTGHYLAGGLGYYFWGEGHNFFQAFKGRVTIFSSLQGEGHIFFNG